MKRSYLRPSLAAALAAVLTSAAALAGAELLLLDGQVLRGDSVRREGNVYVLTTETGEVTMPVDLVGSVRFTGTGETKPLALEGIPDGPTGIKVGEAQTLAGQPVEPPRTEDQLRALGRPSTFQKDIVDSNWVPTTDWNMDPYTQNNFAPSTWAEDVVDTKWAPTSAFDADEDVLAESRSTWQKGVVDSSWTPTDGFAK